MAGGERLKTILNAYPLEQYKIGTKEDKDEVVRATPPLPLRANLVLLASFLPPLLPPLLFPPQSRPILFWRCPLLSPNSWGRSRYSSCFKMLGFCSFLLELL